MPSKVAISKKSFKKLSKVLDTIFVDILEDVSQRYKIDRSKLIHHYPENKKKKFMKIAIAAK